jgi:hypothetical protein
MKPLHGTVSGILTAGFIGFLSIGHPAFAEQVSRQQILEALTVQPKVASFSDRLRLTRSMTFNDRDYEVASTQSKPAIDLEINFDFNSAAITAPSATARRGRRTPRTPENRRVEVVNLAPQAQASR